MNGEERGQMLSYMAYSIIEQHKKQNAGKSPSKLYMNSVMFLMAKRLKEAGMDVELPYWWDVNGVEVDWAQVPGVSVSDDIEG